MTVKTVKTTCLEISRPEVRAIIEAALFARGVPFPETVDHFGFCDTPDGLRLVWEVRREEKAEEKKL